VNIRINSILPETRVHAELEFIGNPKSLILAPIKSMYVTSYWSSIVTLVLSCPVLYLVFTCLFSCTVFVLSFCMFIFLYCFVCQYQSSDWL